MAINPDFAVRVKQHYFVAQNWFGSDGAICPPVFYYAELFVAD